MRAALWTCGCATFGVLGIVGGVLLWAAQARVAEERSAVADLRRVTLQAGVDLPRTLRLEERFDDQRDHLRVKAWNFTSSERLAVEGLRARSPSDGESELDEEMLQKQFPERRMRSVLQKRWAYGGRTYWVLTAKDAGAWHTLFQSEEVVP